MSTSDDPSCLRAFACELAQLGGMIAAEHMGRVSVSRKADASPVTEADHLVQDAILKALADRFPSHSILVEESVKHPGRHAKLDAGGHCWVIDPIDGTRNYARGVRVYATSVAVMHGGRTIAGAVHDATSGVIYSAAHGCGAFRGSDPIIIRDRPVNRDTAVALGSFRRTSVPPSVRRWIDQYSVRNYGSTALHLAWIAGGLVDAAYSNECKLWDFAAGALLIEEAGGLFSDEQGRSHWPCDLAHGGEGDFNVVAGAAAIHQQLVDSLR